MKRLLAALVLTAVSASAQELRVRVTEVHNGNTISVREPGRQGTLVVRLDSIVVPGRWRPFAARSRESLRQLVKHKQVTLYVRESGGGRATGTVLLDDLDVGLEQVRRGLAWYEPGDENLAAYEAAEAEARQSRTGLWSQQR
jgi:endonuclease YncB( thermonuclease family)